MFVMTRAQKKITDDRSVNNKDNEMTDLNKSIDKWPDKPRVVDILRKPCTTVEMTLINSNELNILRSKDLVDKASLLYQVD